MRISIPVEKIYHIAKSATILVVMRMEDFELSNSNKRLLLLYGNKAL